MPSFPEFTTRINYPIIRLPVSGSANSLAILRPYMTTTGIHGFPKVKWDNVEDAGLYYPHNTFTFPTWHRPYMLLYEVWRKFLLMP
jgi:hypothetical protein